MDDTLSAWLATSIGTSANDYCPGFKIFPCHGIRADLTCTCGQNLCGKDNRNAGKHPATKNGVLDASNNIVEVAALFQYRSDLNIGIATGADSGFFVLDVDAQKGGMISLEILMTTYEKLPPSVISDTGTGCHIWFSYPKDVQVRNRTDFMPGLDIRGSGGYIIAPPSTHRSGKKYAWSPNNTGSTAEAPIWFLSLIQQVRKEERKPLSSDHSTGARSEWSEDEVWKMLENIDPDCNYDDWLHVGMALQSGGYKLSFWDNWSRQGEKYDNGDCENRWHGFRPDSGITMGTLVDMAQKNGWTPTPVARRETDTSAADALVTKAKEMLQPVIPKRSRGKLIFDPLELPGLIGNTVRWITHNAIKKQPELALLNVIAFAGAVFGRRYCSPINTRTNIYTVGIAVTGSGKDHSRKAIKELAHAAGLDERIGADDIRSDSGLLRGLMANASQVMMIDEFGHFLEAVGNEKSPHYIKSQSKVLLKLYSSSNSIYHHGDYADTKNDPIVIEYPNLCIYGTSTEEKYIKSLKKDAIESGELNRFIAIRSNVGKQYPLEDLPEPELDMDVVYAWQQFSPKFGASLGEIINSSGCYPDVVKVAWGECKKIQHIIHCKQEDNSHDLGSVKHLWSRLYENTIKIAMIFAIARDKNNPEFKKEDFDVAQSIVECSIEYLSSLANDHMSDSPQEESNQEIVNAIRQSGGKMAHRDIMRKFRKLKKRDLEEVINSLIEQEMIVVDKDEPDGRGRPKRSYRIISDISLAA